MKKTTLLSLVILISVLITGSIHSQEKKPLSKKVFGQNLSSQNLKGLQEHGIIRCASDEYEAYLQEINPNRATEQEFENWLAPKLLETKKKLKDNQLRDVNTLMTIPIIFHVFTDGSGVDNVSEELIIAQVDQLNIDYANLAGSSFDVAADTEIQFCLAQVDEDGVQLDEPGINRITDYGDGPFSTAEIESTLKAATQWDPTQYFNVWVANISGGILGYAHWPENTTLDGLDPSDIGTIGPASTDGVAITSSSVGSVENPNPTGGIYANGRTLTHEAGHWLGLRHIWGDGGCFVDDYCDDTPAAGQANYDCVTTDSCTLGNTDNDMIENYMDYTNDLCMDTFTADQSLRIATVMANSPRRMELSTSTVCEPAMVYDLDGRVKIDNLNLNDCEFTITPEINIINSGNTILTTANIGYDVDGGSNEFYSWSGSLAFGESETITLPMMTIAEGSHTFNVYVSNPNGSTDMNTANDDDDEDFSISPSFFGSTSIELEIVTDNYGSETTWELTDSSDTVLYSGGSYSNNTTYNETFTIENNECYTFTIWDSYGDGICCDWGEGSYTLTDNNDTVIFAGGEFGEVESTKITTFSLSTQEFELENSISIYPNPVNGILNIKVTNSDLPESFIIYNTLGQVITQKAINSNADLLITTSAYSNGMYFIKILKGNSAISLPFIKQ